MAREYGFQDVAAGIGTSNKLLHPPAEVHLEDVADFLDWLRIDEPRLEVGAALQGLAGLQLQEATRLTWQKVDLSQQKRDDG